MTVIHSYENTRERHHWPSMTCNAWWYAYSDIARYCACPQRIQYISAWYPHVTVPHSLADTCMQAFDWYLQWNWPWTSYWPLFCVISLHSVALGARYVTVIEDRPILSATEMWTKECCLWYSHKLLRKSALTRGNPSQKRKLELCNIVRSHLSNSWALVTSVT